MADLAVKFHHIFGEDSFGSTFRTRAATSTRRFVRSQHQITTWATGATGYVIDATEAFRLLGRRMEEFADKDAVPILCHPDEPYASIERRLTQLGLNFGVVADALSWNSSIQSDFVARRQISFFEWMKISDLLDLNWTNLGFKSLAMSESDHWTTAIRHL